MKKLFEYVVLFHPKVTKDQCGNETQGPDEIIVEPERVLADNEQLVQMLAARKIPDRYADKLDQVEILVRPFP